MPSVFLALRKDMPLPGIVRKRLTHKKNTNISHMAEVKKALLESADTFIIHYAKIKASLGRIFRIEAMLIILIFCE